MSNLKVCFVSDLHLEFRGLNFQNIINTNADILCLAGDISACGNERDFHSFVEFLKFISKKFIYILHVAGNHEYYTAGEKKITKKHTMEEIDKKIKSLETIIKNFVYLQCKSIILTIKQKKYVFIGATLWAYVKPEDKKKVQEAMNDYNFIYTLKKEGSKQIIKKYTVDDMVKLHQKHFNYLKKALEKYKHYICVVITHHKPIADTKNPDVLTQAYESDLSKLFSRYSNVRIAIHGHTHKHYDKIIQGVRYMSNPKGYIGQHTKFDDKLIIKI